MSLLASLVTSSVGPSNTEGLRKRVQEHLVPVAWKRPGYHGFLLLDEGDDRRLASLVFERPEQVRQAQAALTPVGEEQTYALMSGPAIGSIARVLIDDGVLD